MLFASFPVSLQNTSNNLSKYRNIFHDLWSERLPKVAHANVATSEPNYPAAISEYTM